MVKRIKQTITIVVATDVRIASSPATYLSGKLNGIILDCPTLDASATMKVDVLDADGYTVFSKSAMAANTKTPVYIDANNQPLVIPMAGNITVKVTASADQVTDKAIVVALLYDTAINGT